MTFVEQIWLDARFAGNDVTSTTATCERRPNGPSSIARPGSVVTISSTRVASDELARGHDLGELVRRPGGDRERSTFAGLHPPDRGVRTDCGHADLIRELIDGTTGY